jgi:hypothetical protein
MKSPIGGYFEWEFANSANLFPHCDGALVNSGRHALEYILLSLGSVKRIYVPYFTCEVVLQPIQRLHIPYKFYHINEALEIADEINLHDEEFIIYTNYFGIKDRYVASLVESYGDKLIIDNAQAFFAKSYSQSSQFYSPRKFVGCPDGGIAIPVNKAFALDLRHGKSANKCASLLERTDSDVSIGYDSFHNAAKIIGGENLTQMSDITRGILSNLDYSNIVDKRRTNFNYLHSHLAISNKLGEIVSTKLLSEIECPMVYPYWTDDIDLRKELISNKVFVAKYWPNVPQWCESKDLEYQLTEQIIPLPIDQRYGQDEMDYILYIIDKFKN